MTQQNTQCICNNPENGFACTCNWVRAHPGTIDYSCIFCGLYTASWQRCNLCKKEQLNYKQLAAEKNKVSAKTLSQIIADLKEYLISKLKEFAPNTEVTEESNEDVKFKAIDVAFKEIYTTMRIMKNSSFISKANFDTTYVDTSVLNQLCFQVDNMKNIMKSIAK